MSVRHTHHFWESHKKVLVRLLKGRSLKIILIKHQFAFGPLIHTKQHFTLQLTQHKVTGSDMLRCFAHWNRSYRNA